MCVCILENAFYKPSPVVGTDVAKTLICYTGTTCEWKHMRESACTSVSLHTCMHVTRLYLRDREADFGVVFFESERTRAKGVVAKEAWGDYKDLGL